MSDLSKNQARALRAILAHPTLTAAAAACGLATRTLYRYLSDPVFKAALRGRQDEVIAAAVAALAGLAGDAIRVLRDLLKDEGASPSTRARVALGILDRWQSLTTFADLEQRIAKLEERQNEPGKTS